MSCHHRLLCLLFCAGVLLTGWSRADAQAIARFSATTANIDPAGEVVRIDLLRWATPDQREAALEAIRDAPAESGDLDALLDLQTLGHVWPSTGGLGYSIKYAHREERPDGGEWITLVTGRRLGRFGRAPWRPADAPETPVRPFTVIELRLDADGQGEGKLSAGTAIEVDVENGVVEIVDYDAQPVALESVARRPDGYSGE